MTMQEELEHFSTDESAAETVVSKEMLNKLFQTEDGKFSIVLDQVSEDDRFQRRGQSRSLAGFKHAKGPARSRSQTSRTSGEASTPRNSGSQPASTPRNSGSQPVITPRNSGSHSAITPRNSGSQQAITPRNSGSQQSITPRNSGSQQATTPPRNSGSHSGQSTTPRNSDISTTGKTRERTRSNSVEHNARPIRENQDKRQIACIDLSELGIRPNHEADPLSSEEEEDINEEEEEEEEEVEPISRKNSSLDKPISDVIVDEIPPVPPRKRTSDADVKPSPQPSRAVTPRSSETDPTSTRKTYKASQNPKKWSEYFQKDHTNWLSVGDDKIIEYFTDVEGNWDYFLSFVSRSQILSFEGDHRGVWGRGTLALKKEGILVFGGDASDKGPGDIRIVKLLSKLKESYPEQVFMILGNREFTKLRFHSELQDVCPIWIPTWGAPTVSFEDFIKKNEGLKRDKIGKLRWLLDQTMGCPETFDTRTEELALLKGTASDDDVLHSYMDSVNPDGEDPWMLKFIMQSQIALVINDILFVHGGVQEEALGHVPGLKDKCKDVKEWVTELNKWKQREMKDFITKPTILEDVKGTVQLCRGASELMNYGTLGGGKTTVIYYNPFQESKDDPEDGNPRLRTEKVQQFLLESDIKRVISGHQPHGETPTVVRHPQTGLLVITADTSRSDGKKAFRVNPADHRGNAISMVRFQGQKVTIEGQLKDQRRHGFTLDTDPEKDQMPDKLVGRQLNDKSWVKTVIREADKENPDLENPDLHSVRFNGWNLKFQNFWKQDKTCQMLLETFRTSDDLKVDPVDIAAAKDNPKADMPQEKPQTEQSLKAMTHTNSGRRSREGRRLSDYGPLPFDANKNYYAILGVEHDATREEIRKAYQENLKLYMPDGASGNHRKSNSLQLAAYQKAYEIFKDPQMKEAYDDARGLTVRSWYPNGSPAKSQPSTPRNPVETPRKASIGSIVYADEDVRPINGDQTPRKASIGSIVYADEDVQPHKRDQVRRKSAVKSVTEIQTFYRADCRFTRQDTASFCLIPSESRGSNDFLIQELPPHSARTSEIRTLLGQTDVALKTLKNKKKSPSSNVSSSAQLLPAFLTALGGHFKDACEKLTDDIQDRQMQTYEGQPLALAILFRLVEVLDVLVPVEGDIFEKAVTEGEALAPSGGGEVNSRFEENIADALRQTLGPSGFLSHCLRTVLVVVENETPETNSTTWYLKQKGAAHFAEEFEIHIFLALRLVLSWNDPQGRLESSFTASTGQKRIVECFLGSLKELKELTKDDVMRIEHLLSRLALITDILRVSLRTETGMDGLIMYSPGSEASRDAGATPRSSQAVCEQSSGGRKQRRKSHGPHDFFPLDFVIVDLADTIYNFDFKDGDVFDVALSCSLRLFAVLLDINVISHDREMDTFADVLKKFFDEKNMVTLRLAFAVREIVTSPESSRTWFLKGLSKHRHRLNKQFAKEELLAKIIEVLQSQLPNRNYDACHEEPRPSVGEKPSEKKLALLADQVFGIVRAIHGHSSHHEDRLKAISADLRIRFSPSGSPDCSECEGKSTQSTRRPSMSLVRKMIALGTMCTTPQDSE